MTKLNSHIILVAVLSAAAVTFAAEPKSDPLGTKLPPGITPEAVVKLIAPRADASLARLVGMKKWPHRPDTYIAIACIATSRTEFDAEAKSPGNEACCEAGYGDGTSGGYNPKTVYLAAVEYRDALRLIATTAAPLSVGFGWKNTQIESPGFMESDSILPARYTRFDFAKYAVSPTQVAFGLRVQWSEMYAGGGASFEGLMLFVVDGTRIRCVLNEPVAVSQTIAGEWHEDGTRDHEFIDVKNVVVVQSASTNGHFDLQLKQSDGTWRKVFFWDGATGRYLPR